jgi:hypothetical protein
MKTTRLTSILALLFLATAIAFSGCTPHRKAAVVPSPSCSQALGGGLSGYSDYEIAELLDKAQNESGLEQCWIPLMQSCLDQRREIPRHHLAKAVHEFNKNRYSSYFHQAVQRYLGDIAKTGGSLSPQDRRLLETYCSFVINNARYGSDENLTHAKYLCKRLDPELYAKFFN